MNMETKLLIRNVTELFYLLESELEEVNKEIELDISWTVIDDIKGILLDLNEEIFKR